MRASLLWRIAAVATCISPIATSNIYAAQPVIIEITGADLAAGQFSSNPPFAGGPALNYRRGARPAPSNNAPADPPVTFGYYPGDVQNPGNGPTLKNLTVHDIFVNPVVQSGGVYAQGPAGPTLTDVDSFVDNLNRSDFIHLTDQYTNTANPTRTTGTPGVIFYDAQRTTLYDADVAVLVHAATRTFGSGYQNIYHLFFPQGIDVCTAEGNGVACYSPDNPSTFAFCGYHGYLNFGDLGHAIFSVEPYDNVSGCSVPTQPAGISPNGPRIDSMANVLSHEIFEAISDPDLNAWYNHRGVLGGAEIGDECAWVFALPAVSLNGNPYQIQSEYSNLQHACIWTSSGPPTP